MHSENFARRRDMFSRARGHYLWMRVDSRGGVDNSDDDEASSTSGVSTQSLRSYRSWRRAQRNKRKELKRAASVIDCGAAARAPYFNQINSAQAFPKSQMSIPGDKDMRTVDALADSSNVDSSSTHLNAYQSDQSVEQPSLQPYYSSSPLTTSETDSDAVTSPARPHTIQVAEDVEEKELRIKQLKQIKNSSKDPLQRRSYPFTVRSIDTVTQKEVENPIFLFPTVGNDQQKEIKSQAINSLQGLNDKTLLQADQSGGNRSPLLQLARLKMKQPSIEDISQKHDMISPDAVYTESHGFTLRMPINSPSRSPHQVRTNNSNQQVSKAAVTALSDEIAFERTSKTIETSSGSEMEGQGQNSRKNQQSDTTLITTSEHNLVLEQKAVQLDPGMYFLPPLVAKAIQNKNAEISKGVHESCPEHRNSTPTEEIIKETSYLENNENLFNDIQEDDFLKPAIRALPESDTCSIATTGSNQFQEDDLEYFSNENRNLVPPVDSTKSNNYPNKRTEEDIQVVLVAPEEAGVTPNEINTISKHTFAEGQKRETDPEAQSTRSHSHGVDKGYTECKTNENISALHVSPVSAASSIETKKTRQKTDKPDAKFPVFSHKVGSDKSCPVCGKKEEKVSIAKSQTIMEAGVTEEVVKKVQCGMEEGIPESLPRKPVHSHKVGDDSKCGVCSNQNQKAKDPFSELCCNIL